VENHSKARQYYCSARQKLPDVDKHNQKIGLLMARVYLDLLAQIERADFPVLQRKIRLTMWRKVMLILVGMFRTD